MDKAIAPALPPGSLYMEEVHAKVWLLSAWVLVFLYKYIPKLDYSLPA